MKSSSLPPCSASRSFSPPSNASCAPQSPHTRHDPAKRKSPTESCDGKDPRNTRCAGSGFRVDGL
eukprot:954932-Rhodomonas_salina.1